MKTKLFFIVTTMLVLLSSCNPNRNVLFITFEDGENISEGNPVLVNGYKVGRVDHIEFDENYLLRVKIRFFKEQKIPIDSKFTIGSEDLFRKAVLIDPGMSKTSLTAKDDIRGLKSPTVDLDKVLNWFTDRLDDSEIKTAADSIAAGLNELSEKLEDLENLEIEIKKYEE